MTEKLNDLIDKMYLLREEKRSLEARKKEVQTSMDELQKILLGRLKEVGTDYARGSMASATVTETVVPTIQDWGEVAEWIKENDAMYLCYRRVAQGPWKELMDAGVEVPGVEPFTKIGISLTTLGD